jgi:hypothetical protein
MERLKLLGIPLLVLVLVEPGAGNPDPGPLRDAPASFQVIEADKVGLALAQLNL